MIKIFVDFIDSKSSGATSSFSFDVDSTTSPFRVTPSSTKSATGPVNTQYFDQKIKSQS